jgi:16S rRNA (cytosine1402-N4)-methyltransferase
MSARSGTNAAPGGYQGGHLPVMAAEVIAALQPRAGAVYVDGTFGGGGYSRAILTAARCKVWGIDRDPEAIARGAAMTKEFDGKLQLVEGRFGDMAGLLRTRNVTGVDGIAFDIGVSSQQIDDPERGFSFRHDGPLDMRMDKSGASAKDAVNTLSEKELADIIYEYGEERRSRQVARAIVAHRENQAITRTDEFASLVRSVVPASRDGIDPATRTFQAFRIYVNDELGELDRGLDAAEELLTPGGRLAVVSFHSLEDRRVKSFMRTRSGAGPKESRHLPANTKGPAPSFLLLNRRPIKSSADEIAANPRARSARLRAAERTAAPPWRAAAIAGSESMH